VQNLTLTILCFGVLFLALVAVEGLMPSQIRAPALEAQHLDAQVFVLGDQMTVHNSGPGAWSNCSANLNMHGFSLGYTLQMGAIPARDTKVISLTEFADSDGNRFNPAALKVLNLLLHCSTPKGDGSFYSEVQGPK
jgi:hypothetical protein